MLTRQELTKSPLFQDIRYEDYQRMLDCFQAVQRSYRPDDVVPAAIPWAWWSAERPP